MTIARQHLATTAFATIVTAMVLSSQPGQAREEATAAAVVVHQLPRVVVTGQVQRSPAVRVVELPRVVVSARRADSLPTVVVQAPARPVGERS